MKNAKEPTQEEIDSVSGPARVSLIARFADKRRDVVERLLDCGYTKVEVADMLGISTQGLYKGKTK